MATSSGLTQLQMTELTLYHNPRCSKSRSALELLEARGLTPAIVRYRETPPTAAQLRALLDKLGLSARQLLRTGEDEYKSLALANPELSEAELIEDRTDGEPTKRPRGTALRVGDGMERPRHAEGVP